MKKIVYEECPYCGSKMLVYGYQTEQACAYSDVRGGVFGSQIVHTICRDCGSIIYSSVVRPEVFKEFLDPENKKNYEEAEKNKPKKEKEGILEIIVDEEQK